MRLPSVHSCRVGSPVAVSTVQVYVVSKSVLPLPSESVASEDRKPSPL